MFILTVFLTISITIVSFADEVVLDNYNDFGVQYQLLNFLFENTPYDIVNMTTLYGRINVVDKVSIPNIIGMGVIGIDEDMFLVVLDGEVPKEAIEFILAFTGISQEYIEIEQLISETLLICDGDMEELYSGFTLNFLESITYSYEFGDVEFEPFQITGGVLQMGQMFNLPGIGNITIGHPNNVTGSRFFSSPHRTFTVGTPATQGTRRIGSVTRSFYGGNRDIVEIAVDSGIDMVSIRVPWANRNITNFRGTPHNGSPVRSIRGRSGITNTSIYSSNYRFTTQGQTWTNMIAVYPVRVVQPGDSGSALIHTNGASEIVLGTMRSYITFASGRRLGIYTSVLSY